MNWKVLGIIFFATIFTSCIDDGITHNTVVDSLNQFKNVEHTLVFNNATRNWVLTYTDTNNDLTEACLQVQRISASSSLEICDICDGSQSGTINCNIGTQAQSTRAIFYGT